VIPGALPEESVSETGNFCFRAASCIYMRRRGLTKIVGIAVAAGFFCLMPMVFAFMPEAGSPPAANRDSAVPMLGETLPYGPMADSSAGSPELSRLPTERGPRNL
jgi:hypothetical protein